MHKKITPEEIIPGNDNHAYTSDGRKVRKGTVAAAIACIEVIESTDSSNHEKENAINTLKKLSLDMKALGLLKHMQFKSAKIREITAEAIKQNDQDNL